MIEEQFMYSTETDTLLKLSSYPLQTHSHLSLYQDLWSIRDFFFFSIGFSRTNFKHTLKMTPQDLLAEVLIVLLCIAKDIQK